MTTPKSAVGTPAAKPDPGKREEDNGGNPLVAAFAWAAGCYAMANAAGVILCIALAVSGPAFSVDTPLFEIAALTTPAGKQTSYHLHFWPFIAASAAFGGSAAALKGAVSRK